MLIRTSPPDPHARSIPSAGKPISNVNNSSTDRCAFLFRVNNSKRELSWERRLGRPTTSHCRTLVTSLCFFVLRCSKIQKEKPHPAATASSSGLRWESLYSPAEKPLQEERASSTHSIPPNRLWPIHAGLMQMLQAVRCRAQTHKRALLRTRTHAFMSPYIQTCMHVWIRTPVLSLRWTDGTLLIPWCNAAYYISFWIKMHSIQSQGSNHNKPVHICSYCHMEQHLI